MRELFLSTLDSGLLCPQTMMTLVTERDHYEHMAERHWFTALEWDSLINLLKCLCCLVSFEKPLRHSRKWIVKFTFFCLRYRFFKGHCLPLLMQQTHNTWINTPPHTHPRFITNRSPSPSVTFKFLPTFVYFSSNVDCGWFSSMFYPLMLPILSHMASFHESASAVRGFHF